MSIPSLSRHHWGNLNPTKGFRNGHHSYKKRRGHRRPRSHLRPKPRDLRAWAETRKLLGL